MINNCAVSGPLTHRGHGCRLNDGGDGGHGGHGDNGGQSEELCRSSQ